MPCTQPRKILRLVAAAIAMTPAMAMADDSYPIKLSRPCDVGEQWTEQIKATREESRTWTEPGDSHKPIHEKFQATLDGLVTVNAVSPIGRPTEFTIKIKSCTRDDAVLLPADTTLTAKNVQGVNEFQINGQAPGDDVKRVLDTLVHTARPDEPTLDDQAGTDQPKKVGDSWPINGDQMVKATRLPFKVTGKDFRGQSTLTGVSTTGGKQSETVRIESICLFDTRAGNDGISVNDLVMRRVWNVTVPMDPKSNAHTANADFVVRYTFVGQTGKQLVEAKNTTESVYADVAK